jgi:RecB family exonuclease
MPLRAVRSASSEALWDAFTRAFLDANAGLTGPGRFRAYAWLTHRIHRDRLYEAAVARGVPAWLGPPVAFFSDLPRLFDVRQRPIGLLRRQAVLDDLAHARGTEDLAGGPTAFDRAGIGRAHDRLVGDLLAERITPEELARALDGLEGDAFAARRNAWVVAVYRDYLARIAAEDRYDPRAIHALVAERIGTGVLPAVLGGAGALHIYGLTTVRTRRRLLEALRTQPTVDVVVYVPAGADSRDWENVVGQCDDLDGAPPPVVVQPTPDERRELDWIAVQVKRLIVQGGVRPDRVAVVARSGREDLRAAHETLTAAGVPATARLRAGLAEVPALKAVLLLLRAAARNWPYRQLRQVLASPYFDLAMDLRPLDALAAERRITGLETWAAALTEQAGSGGEPAEEDDDARGARRREDAAQFTAFAGQVRALAAPRSTAQWIALTRELLDPGWFGFRERICCMDVGTDRLDIVRLDQQAIGALGALLQEWADAESGDEPVEPRAWAARLRRFLTNNEITLSTPLRTGVQLLEAHEAALFPFDYVFVLHANDGEFPKRPGTSWLFTDAELAALAQAGLPVTDRAEWLRRERVLWQAVAAGPATTVTYRTADPDGVPLLPSLVVPPHDAAVEIPRTRFVWDDPVTAAHGDRLAIRTLQEAMPAGATAPVAVPRVAPVRRAILAAVAERERITTLEGPWGGLLRDPVVVANLARRFGADRVWSASQLEEYGTNPFSFLLHRVLHLEELAEAEEDTNALTFGGIAHEILERFYGACRGALPAVFDDATRARYDEIATTVLAAREARGEWLGLPVLWAITRRGIVRTVGDYLAWELERFGDRQPHALEWAFGFDAPAEIEWRDVTGRTVRLRARGRVDRVDRDRGGALHIVDYKSGFTPPAKQFDDGASLQGPLYMQALAALAGGPVKTAEYRSIKKQRVERPIPWGSNPFERALAIAFSIPARVREGRFEPLVAHSLSGKWMAWWPGPDILRLTEFWPDGSRFHD